MLCIEIPRYFRLLRTAAFGLAGLTLMTTLSPGAGAQQQPGSGDPGYLRVQGQDQAAPALPTIGGFSGPLLDYREEMRSFTQRLSTYARQVRRNFGVVVRDPDEMIIKRDVQDERIILPARTFMRSIDGVMVDGVFAGHSIIGQPPEPDVQQQIFDRIERAKTSGLAVLSYDIARTPSAIDQIYQASIAKGMVPLVAHRPSYDMTELHPYPKRPHRENPNNVLALKDVKNYAYISDPAAFGRQDQFALTLHGTNYDMLIVDPFSGREPLSKQAIETLKYKKLGAKRLVYARMNIGTASSHRFYWKNGWGEGNPSFITTPYPGEPDRYFVEYWKPGWQDLMFGNPQSYLYGLIAQGYDGVVLEGMRSFLVFEGNIELDQEFAPVLEKAPQ